MKKRNFVDRMIHKSLSFCFRLGSRLLCVLGLTKPKVIVMMDGGICSQMVQYLGGYLYKDASVEILYDVRFFSENGKDWDGKFERRFELTEMFPSLPFARLSMRQSNFYRSFFSYGQSGSVYPEPKSIKRTIYLGGYYHLPQTCDFKSMIFDCFNLHAASEIPAHIISNPNGINCAVHIRRGDLANRNLGGYEMVSDEYFFKAIDDVVEKYKNVKFFFFSDEPEYVLENICPRIRQHYHLMQGNKAWVDLALIAECDVVIASQGSFGTMAARLNGHSDLYVPSPESVLGFEIKNFSKEVF